MAEMCKILEELTGMARSQDLAYTRDATKVNTYFDNKITEALSQISALLISEMEKEKVLNGDKAYWGEMNKTIQMCQDIVKKMCGV